MEGSGKNLMKMIAIVLLTVGMFVGQITASSVCFYPCYNECMEPNPESEDLSLTCIDKCAVLSCLSPTKLAN
ncbi:hypothetical protein MKW94_026580 [Papaver nudicaule]|uniref:Uncharacterized protein n=1 Tax=Papaver nudicaule TaxID=74823 RepID=A0AA41W335_PAPNU|nr:hypothetical protein [Papaver nudicaule]